MTDLWNDDLEALAPIAQTSIKPCCTCTKWCGNIEHCQGLAIPEFLKRKPKEIIEW